MVLKNFRHKIKETLSTLAIHNYKMRKKILINVNNIQSEKSVLIYYITRPFTTSALDTHTNLREVRILVDVFTELGFAVDLCDYSNKVDLEKDYDVVLGFGDLYNDRVSSSSGSIFIHYATGAPQYLNNIAENKRVKDFEIRNGERLLARRNVDRTWAASEILSDAIITVGSWAEEQYSRRHRNVHRVRISSLSRVLDISLDRKKTNEFVWFGSAGALHKGLDWCIECFAKTPDLKLKICANLDAEKDFLNFYNRELSLQNIEYLGFVPIGSESFVDLVETSAFVLLPSCSEGCSTSVLTMMKYGCIPIVTEQTSIDFEGRVTVSNIQNLEIAVKNAASLPREQLKIRSQNCIDWIENNHNLSVFKNDMTHVLKTILQ
jgi:glycosyltransferase involved in cell wall biosynthesis